MLYNILFTVFVCFCDFQCQFCCQISFFAVCLLCIVNFLCSDLSNFSVPRQFCVVKLPISQHCTFFISTAIFRVVKLPISRLCYILEFRCHFCVFKLPLCRFFKHFGFPRPVSPTFSTTTLPPFQPHKVFQTTNQTSFSPAPPQLGVSRLHTGQCPGAQGQGRDLQYNNSCSALANDKHVEVHSHLSSSRMGLQCAIEPDSHQSIILPTFASRSMNFAHCMATSPFNPFQKIEQRFQFPPRPSHHGFRKPASKSVRKAIPTEGGKVKKFGFPHAISGFLLGERARQSCVRNSVDT